MQWFVWMTRFPEETPVVANPVEGLGQGSIFLTESVPNFIILYLSEFKRFYSDLVLSYSEKTATALKATPDHSRIKT
jgi:hypothetical protein